MHRGFTKYVSMVVGMLGYLTAALAGTACDDSKEAPGYYLSGHVLNGSTLEPIEGATLSLTADGQSKRAKSNAQGVFRIGPIPERVSYRLSAEHEGFDAFAFDGAALPKLEVEGDTKILAGDVVLYEAGIESPAFNITVQSRDPRVSLNSELTEVRLSPLQVGTDPAFAGTLGPDAASASVIGAYREPRGVTLINHARVGTQGYRSPLVSGSAEIPAGALRFGATYAVEVDGDPTFAPARFLLTAVRGDDVQVFLETVRAPSASTGLPDTIEQYFTGRIYDGVSLTRLTGYTIRLEYFDRILHGTVDATGRYVVGPLLANADYSIVIEADGYRSFLSHNKRLAVSSTNVPLTSFYYDAFLYPEGVPSPAVRCRFRLSGSTDLPTGFVRLAPRSTSTLFDEEEETPAGVERQVWSNDDDLQQRTVVREVVDGDATFMAGELVYGVEYAVTVYGVEDFGLTGPASFRAGIDTNPTWILDPLSTTPLEVAHVSSDDLAPSPDGSVVIRFNQPVALSPRVAESTALMALNQGFSIDSPDADGDGTSNTLAPASDNPTFRGVTFSVAGDTLTLKWNRANALATEDADDPIRSVVYGNLSSVMVYSLAAPVPAASSLLTLLGTASLNVQVSPL